jgi:protein involved in polysaccharide export with SLBB domain
VGGRSNFSTETYKIDVGDQLDISVVGHDELATTVIVLQDGTISVPSIGVVHVGGLSVTDATVLVAKKLGVTINQPDVSVSVTPANDPKVSVLGAVKNPGQYIIKKDFHVADALALAGGLNQDPKLTDATLVKAGGKGTSAINIKALITNADPAQNLLIEPGDVIFVTALDEKWLQVQVAGEVTKPGSVPISKDGILVAAALAAAGGATKDAELSKAQIMHDGKVTLIDLYKASTNLDDPVGKILLQPGDVLSVPENRNKIGVMGQVQTPAPYVIPDGETMTVSKALVLAGGLTKDADIHHASLMTYDAKGNAVVTDFDAGKLMEGKVTDYKMTKGDAIFIPSRTAPSVNPLSALVAIGQIGYWLK